MVDIYLISLIYNDNIGFLFSFFNRYYTTNRLTKKSDVYSFGIVLMEIITRKHPHFVDDSVSYSEHIQITNWVSIMYFFSLSFIFKISSTFILTLY